MLCWGALMRAEEEEEKKKTSPEAPPPSGGPEFRGRFGKAISVDTFLYRLFILQGGANHPLMFYCVSS